MTDMENVIALLKKAGRKQWEGEYRPNRDNEDEFYVVNTPEKWRYAGYDNPDCTTSVTVTGQWTGDMTWHFKSDGSVTHLDVSGD